MLLKFDITTLSLTLLALGGLAATKALPPSEVPTIDGYGAVTAFPDGMEQPTDGSRILVDLTADGPREQLNKGVEKLARYVNIYASAGERPARSTIFVVLHGNATELSLSDAAYAKAFGVESNPNLPLIRRLKQTGMEFVVCGQSLTNKGYRPDDAAAEVDVAVSALTALVNRQRAGFAYVPLDH